MSTRLETVLLALGLVVAGCDSSATPGADPADSGGSSAGGAAAGGGGGGASGSGGAPIAGSVSGGSAGSSAAGAGAGGAPGASGAANAGNGGQASADFRYSKTLRLDTTATGANVSEDVERYPLAITLSADNFDFMLAREKGEDLRFFDAAGAPLAHATELWDRAASRAAIWIKLPVVKGNAATQEIVMRWGSTLAADVSDQKRVFDQESGFLGVYHLDQDGGTAQDGFADASWNGVHGTGQRLGAGSLVNGRIGNGTKLTNPGGGAKNAQWIRVGGAKVTDDFNATAQHPITASVWAWADSFGGYYETVFSKGDRSWTLQRDYQGRMETCTRVEGYHACAIAGPPATKVWVHYMIAQRPGKLTLYINGKLEASADGTSLLGPHDFGIGNQSQYPNEERGWDGILDEARVLSVEKGAAWAKLDYESQREGQKVVLFGPTTP